MNAPAPAPSAQQPPSNAQVAATLEEVASLLETQGANPYRVAAYRRAATTLRERAEPVHELVFTVGVAGLMELPGVGQSLAHSIEHLVRCGRLHMLERLRGEHAAERIFATIAGIGPHLARAIHEALGIETLHELDACARDGRLARVPGMGEKRLRAVRESLAGRFHHSSQPVPPPAPAATAAVPVAELLDVDAEYRELARKNKLPRIAPRRFNPTSEAWLPVLHTERGTRHYTALYSNTARAHELGVTHDWVVIYRDDDQRGTWTVITSQFSHLRGRRVVRGREEECAGHYAAHPESATAPLPPAPTETSHVPPAPHRYQLTLFPTADPPPRGRRQE